MATNAPIRVTFNGFQWGPLEVLRTRRFRQGYVVTIRTSRSGTWPGTVRRQIDVYVSKSGRKIRVVDDQTMP